MSPKTFICDNIVKSYGKKEVIKGLQLTLEPSRIYGLIGRNGAGKTTLLSMMTAQIRTDSGAVTYGGEPVWENEAVLHEMCFSRELSNDASNPINAMKGKEYLKFASLSFPYWDAAYAARLIEKFEINPNQRICKMSKGQSSALSIVLALASRAPFTLLDEPVAGLDVVARDIFYQLLLDDYAETGRTFVLSTHIIEEAASLLEEVLILSDGVICEQQNTEELIAQFRYVSGNKEDLARLSGAFEVVHTESLGRMQTVCLRGKDGAVEDAAAGLSVDISRVPLSKIFVYLTEKIKEKQHDS